MIKKSYLILFALTLSFLFIVNFVVKAENFELDIDDESESLDISKEKNEHDVYFDCDSIFESSKNKVNLKLVDDYNIIPDISGNGNILFNVTKTDYYINEFELILPQEDGKLELCLYFGDELVRKNVFSSYRDGVYGISTISLYSAKQIVGNLPNQEYMDNDENEGIYVHTPENVSSRDIESGNRGSGQITGTLRWEDDDNQLHYLAGVKVKLYNSSYYTYTNSNGYYEIPLYGYSGNCSLHIYAKNEKIEVKDNNINLYEKVSNLYVIDYIGYNYNYDFTKSIDGDLASAMQIFMAASSFASYADSVVNSTLNGTVPLCQVLYPYVKIGNEPSGCFYSVKNSIGTIHLCPEPPAVQGRPSVAGSWDTIGHEYGHHLQRYNFYLAIDGSHNDEENCLYTSLFINHVTSPYDSRIPTLKDNALKLAFNEAWATFFSIVSQKSFSLGFIPTVGDDVYKSYNGVVQDLSVTNINDLNSNQGGESDELVIMRILFKLWDNSNEQWDTISFSFGTIWNIMRSGSDNNENPKNLYDFINKFYSNSLFASYTNGINKILENYVISPSNLQIDQTINYYIQPTFTWDSNGKDVELENVTPVFKFSNTKFILEFYKLNNDLLFVTDYIYDNTYTLTESQWNLICVSNINSYKVRVKAYAPYGIESGPYYSSFYEYAKPTINQNYLYNINISNSRYYEKQFTINAGTSWQFNITFDHSGYKLIQTFGSQDTKMWLYDSNNILVSESDDEGSSSNSLVFANLQSNTNYKLVVSLFNQTLTATTKLAIINYGGDYQNNNTTIDEFEDILSLNCQTYTYNTSVSQYNATVIVWQPTTTGLYTVGLNSSFDNYLYVINPDSSNYLVDGEDYIDDFPIDEDEGLYDTNAKLYGYFYSYKKYVIIANQVDPSYNGGNIGIRFYFLM